MIGKTVYHYEITEKLGEGGMGVVYKARDLKLDRFVALKFLPASLMADDSAKLRFAREAKAASAIDHQNILTIFEINETEDGQTFIVMPAYEGQTLSARLAGGPLDVTEAIDIVTQVASGLARAHEKGIVHRDLKPDNIFITEDGQAKIVDFGIAKLATQTRVTRTGSTLGTVSYMSPEQIRGEELDHRSDIFSLGIVFYESLTGTLPFEGEHEASMIYSITTSDPKPLIEKRPDLPAALQEIVDRAMDKNTQGRYQDADGFRMDLETLRRAIGPSDTQALSSGTSVVGSGTGGPRRRRGPTIAVVFVIVVVSAFLIWNRSERGSKESVQDVSQRPTVQPALRQVTFAAGVEEYPALSSDGSRIAYSLEADGYRQIFVKDLQSGDERQITNSPADNIQAAWAPDGKAILFVRSHQPDGKMEPGDVFGSHTGGNVWRYEFSTNKETRLIEDAFNPSFSANGSQIAFDASWAGPRRIWISDEAGRNPQQLTFDSSETVSQIIPRWSPDGTMIVFQNIEWTTFDIKVLNVATREIAWVTRDRFQDLNPIWSRNGDAVYFSSYRSGGLNVWRMPVAETGSPSGTARQVTTGAGQDVQLARSDNGSVIAISILHQNADIWRLPVSSKTGRPTGEPEEVIATTREDSRSSWSPDGSRIAFNSDRSGDMNLWVHSLADGSTHQITKGSGGDYQPTWSPDGQKLVFFSARSGNADIWVADIASGELTRLTQDASLEINPFYSPNGEYIAYQSDHDGRRELWLMHADGSGQHPVTSNGAGGHFVLWSPDSKAIIFSSPAAIENQAMQVSIDGTDAMPFATIVGRAHMSFSPDANMVMDVTGHRTLWASPIGSGSPSAVFEFDNPDNRIDYPVWSPDGNWVLFDRVKPQGGDIWLIENLE